jgi:hypothetical protein
MRQATVPIGSAWLNAQPASVKSGNPVGCAMPRIHGTVCNSAVSHEPGLLGAEYAYVANATRNDATAQPSRSERLRRRLATAAGCAGWFDFAHLDDLEHLQLAPVARA